MSSKCLIFLLVIITGTSAFLDKLFHKDEDSGDGSKDKTEGDSKTSEDKEDKSKDSEDKDSDETTSDDKDNKDKDGEDKTSEDKSSEDKDSEDKDETSKDKDSNDKSNEDEDGKDKQPDDEDGSDKPSDDQDSKDKEPGDEDKPSDKPSDDQGPKDKEPGDEDKPSDDQGPKDKEPGDEDKPSDKPSDDQGPKDNDDKDKSGDDDKNPEEGKPDCRPLTPLEQLNTANFSGTWYQYATYGTMFVHGLDKCVESQYTMSEDKTTLEILNKRQIIKSNTLLTSKWQAVVRSESHTDGNLTITMHFPFFGSKEIHYYVLGTDYANWALTLVCGKVGRLSFEAAYIFTRKRVIVGDALTQIDGAINPILQRTNISREEFSETLQDDCDRPVTVAQTITSLLGKGLSFLVSGGGLALLLG